MDLPADEWRPLRRRLLCMARARTSLAPSTETTLPSGACRSPDLPSPSTALPDVPFANAIISLTLRTGSEGCTTSALGTSDMSDVKTKSRSGWYSILSRNTGWATSVPDAPSRTVYPSGGDLATKVDPILPPAPPRFSMSTGCPENLRKSRRDGPRRDVDVSAGCERDDDADRFGWVALAIGAYRCEGYHAANR
jgi:hypothetical protein